MKEKVLFWLFLAGGVAFCALVIAGVLSLFGLPFWPWFIGVLIAAAIVLLFNRIQGD